MPLNIEQKKEVVRELNLFATESVSGAIAEYSGLSVSDLSHLRNKARESGVYLRVVKNTLIVFDEFYAWGRKEYPLWYEHEYLACKEWVEKYDREFEVISHNYHQQCCIKVLN